MAFALTKTVLRSVYHRPLICVSKMTISSNAAVATSVPTVLDKTSFSERWKLFALRVPAKLCNGTRKAVKDHALAMQRVQSVVKPEKPEGEANLVPIVFILLKYFAEKPNCRYPNLLRGNSDKTFFGGKTDDVARKLRSLQLPNNTPLAVETFVRGVQSKDLTVREVVISYDHWSIDSVLRALCPEGVTIPTSFESVGHIAHLNLRDEHTPYKKIIGEVMLDKLGPRVRTIVNKLQSTGGPYRTFAMEVLAGDDDMETSVKESGCTFKLNFAKVYWNSRLETEHRRIIQSLKKDDILADAFCGIGPFTVPAAKQKKCKKVYANDLNPSSVHYLRENVKANRLDESYILTSNFCAREFLRRLVRDERVPITRVVMNFPAGAPEFLDVFRGLYNEWEGVKPPMPVIHCYCFVKGIDDMDDARRRVRAALFAERADESSEDLLDADLDVREVRDVAPRKRQVCVTFRVPECVAFFEQCVEEGIEPPEKKPRITSEAKEDMVT